MKTYTIHAGAVVWRTTQPIAIGLAHLTGIGATIDNWEDVISDRTVTYTDEDRLTPPEHVQVHYLYFRLPASALPYTMVEVHTKSVQFPS